MGCDGGTIPRRDELVRLKKKPEQKDKDAEREFRWLHCALTQERLQEPIVMCGLGRLYSKQNVIEQLLEKEKMPESAQHIKSMKDIKTLNLEPNPAYVAEDRSGDAPSARNAPFICKLIGLEMSGKFRFVALWSCGCVMSERALKQIKGTANICPLCQTPFSIEDVIVLNGNDEDLELMQVKIEMRSAKRKASKKEKKQKDNKEHATTVTKGAPVLNENKEDSNDAVEASISKKNTSEEVASNYIASVTKTATSNGCNSVAKSKLVANIKRPGSANENPLEDPDIKRLKTDYSVAKDPKASDVYKSLFTSHKSEKEQSRAHWVTYNPFYN